MTNGQFEYLAGKRVLVTGGGGFIGGHLVPAIRDHGAAHVRSVDCKQFSDWYQRHDGVENLQHDKWQSHSCIISMNELETKAIMPIGHNG